MVAADDVEDDLVAHPGVLEHGRGAVRVAVYVVALHVGEFIVLGRQRLGRAGQASVADQRADADRIEILARELRLPLSQRDRVRGDVERARQQPLVTLAEAHEAGEHRAVVGDAADGDVGELLRALIGLGIVEPAQTAL